MASERRLDMIVQAQLEGESARRAGTAREHNPYNERTHQVQHVGWDQGWYDMDRRVRAIDALPPNAEQA